MPATRGASSSVRSCRYPPAAARSIKDLHRGRGQRLGRCQSGLASRTVEGLKQINVLTFDPQRFASGCDNVHERPLAEEMLSQHRYGLNHMLAAVEDQEDSLVDKERQQSRQGVLGLIETSDCRRDSRNNKRT